MPTKLKEYPSAYPEFEDQITPEKRLLQAVLWRAINDLLPPGPTEQTPIECRQSAREWIFERKTTHFLTFIGVCRDLNKDPEEIRRAVREVMGSGPMCGFQRRDRKVDPPISVP
jgi:hypothetical protein